MLRSDSDTIAAIATARGRAALAIVRLSGPNAVPIVDRLFDAKELGRQDSHTAHVGFFTTLEGERIDQVVVTLFLAPRSATGEDIVEVTCHGGDVASQLILQAMLDAGARLAGPGEFTERAFLNGKLDLAQAEAVAALIHAQSSLAHRVSLNHLQGHYSNAVAGVRSELLQVCALVELELDFAEEDVEFADIERLKRLLVQTETLLTQLLGSYRYGALIRDGVRVVIGGRPNAGKSTLLNALVGRDRAIVSPEAGTTRDEIEAEAELGGLQFRFVDTAGLRDATDTIEAEGVRRAHTAIAHCDALLYLVDATRGLDDEEQTWLERFTVKHSVGDQGYEQQTPPCLLIYNKQDLVAEVPSASVSLPHRSLSAVQAVEHPDALGPIHAWLLDAVASDLTESQSSPIVVNQRHRQHLKNALGAVRKAQAALSAGAGGDILAFDLRDALAELGSITGEITNEDVLTTIFSQFCIGK